MRKNVITWHGRKYYLLGSDKWGRKHYLEESRFDCGWYWGVGYVESFTNNRSPERSRDIASHQHWKGLFGGCTPNPEEFRAVFPDTPLTDSEIWQLSELMRSLYIMRDYSDLLHRGGAGITSNVASGTIKDKAEYLRINKAAIPAILERVYELLTPSEV